VHSSNFSSVRKRLLAFALTALAGLGAAGCHHNQLNSGYGVGFFTVTGEPGQFARYVVTVYSVVLTGKTYGPISVVSLPEAVDFTKLKDISELWSSNAVPTDTYTSAAITLDYSSADIAVLVNGVPKTATIVDSTGATPTTITVTVNLDPNKQYMLNPTLLSSDARRLAFNLDLPLSNSVNLSAATPKVTVTPFVTAAASASDTKPVRVRGALVNSNANILSYSVYVRPFTDLFYTAGTLTLFNSSSTVFTINGQAYMGQAGVEQLTQSSSGSTLVAAITKYQPTTTLSPVVFAAKFEPYYVVGGSTLEDSYTVGIEGDVVARAGNTLTLRNSTLIYPTGAIFYNDADAQILIGPSTTVTADDVPSIAGLNYNSVAVGQHIAVRGLFAENSPGYNTTTGVYTVDATSNAQVNTGSVRLISTQLFGNLIADITGGLTLNLQSINGYPASAYHFAGNGTSTATDSLPASYVVSTTGATLPAAAPAAGDPLWIDGRMAPFGSAPPDFNAAVVNAEAGVQATLLMSWSGTGTTTPFSALDASGMTVNTGNAAFAGGQIQIGAETINVAALPASPSIVPQGVPAPPGDGTPDVFLPLFALGSTANGINVYNTYATFVSKIQSTASTAVLRLSARGTYNRATNTFTAAVINVFN
jgi:hypothetical protein